MSETKDGQLKLHLHNMNILGIFNSRKTALVSCLGQKMANQKLHLGNMNIFEIF